MGKQKSLRRKAVHFVSDLTTVFLNPFSDKPSRDHLHKASPPPPPLDSEEVGESERIPRLGYVSEENNGHSIDGPDTSSFTAFLFSLLSSSESANDDQNDIPVKRTESLADNVIKDTSARRGLLSRGKQSLKAIYNAARIGSHRSQECNVESECKLKNDNDAVDGLEIKHVENELEKEDVSSGDLPDISEPSLLLSEKARTVLYASLPALIQGRKWLLLYSTWRHGISLATLYRRSMLWPGLSLLVVGDRKGAVFGGLVEAPLMPSNKRKYQGTNSTFVFTNTPGYPVVFRPTGANRYFTLCSTDFFAIGGGSHFALYLDGDLLNGSSSVSETYGNPCLAQSEDFEVKEVELWGFVYGSKYEEILALSRTEASGICRW